MHFGTCVVNHRSSERPGVQIRSAPIFGGRCGGRGDACRPACSSCAQGRGRRGSACAGALAFDWWFLAIADTRFDSSRCPTTSRRRAIRDELRRDPDGYRDQYAGNGRLCNPPKRLDRVGGIT
jgi:hypothetical protein